MPDEIVVPRNREAEQAVVGVCIQNAAAFKDCRPLIFDGDFYDPAHELIWAAIACVLDRGEHLDPMGVMQELTKSGQLTRAGGGPYLHTLMEIPVAATNVTYHARIVHETGRARRALQIHQRMGQALGQLQHDPDSLLTQLAKNALDLELLVDEHTGDQPIEGVMRWSQLWANYRPLDQDEEWLIPGLLLPQDVLMVLAGEGGGKSFFSRQFALAMASGIHPFKPRLRIAPRKTLLVDLENARVMVAEESRALGGQVTRLGTWDDEMSTVWMAEDGLDLRKREHAQRLERVIADSGAELVCLGSLYKAYKRGADSWDQAAEETREVFDKIRRRYNCAFILEHHMPKASGTTDRSQSPYGSSEWMRWASLGYIINRVGDNMYEFTKFRGDRMEREFPIGLARGGELPWTPVWDTEEFDMGLWPEILASRKLHRRG